jgi:hypothetical protein
MLPIGTADTARMPTIICGMVMKRTCAAVTVLTLSAGLPCACDLAGPSGKKVRVFQVSGTVGPGQVVTHVVPFDARSEINEVDVYWDNSNSAIGGPRIRAYATRLDCLEFIPPVLPTDTIGNGPCATISGVWGSILSSDAPPSCTTPQILPPECSIYLVARGIAVGNPGTSNYKLHVVGDATRTLSYVLTGTRWG